MSLLTSTSNNNHRNYVCIGSETVSGLASRSSLEWLDPNGDPVPASNGDAVTLIGPVVQATLTTLTLSISLDAVGTSHAGAYTCQGTLVSPALSSPLVKSVQANFTVESKSTNEWDLHAYSNYASHKTVVAKFPKKVIVFSYTLNMFSCSTVLVVQYHVDILHPF